MAADAAIRTALAEWVYSYLSEMNLRGLLVSSSGRQGEADCRWLGMVHLRDYALCPTGARKLWYAEEGVVAGDEGHDPPAAHPRQGGAGRRLAPRAPHRHLPAPASGRGGGRRRVRERWVGCRWPGASLARPQTGLHMLGHASDPLG
jgi:hypothetical protein